MGQCHMSPGITVYILLDFPFLLMSWHLSVFAPSLAQGQKQLITDRCDNKQSPHYYFLMFLHATFVYPFSIIRQKILFIYISTLNANHIQNHDKHVLKLPPYMVNLLGRHIGLATSDYILYIYTIIINHY